MIAALVIAVAMQGPPGTDIFVAPLRVQQGRVHLGTPINATRRAGYDNQPFFLPRGDAFLYTAVRDGQADVFRYDLGAGGTTRVTATPESEYSPTPLPDGSGFSAVRVERDSTQRLWRFDWDGAHPAVLLENVKPVGYHAWGDGHTVALFVLGTPPTLQLADTRTGATSQVAADIGRGVQRIPGRAAISFIQKGADSAWSVVELDLATHQAHPLVQTLRGVDQYAWTPGGILLMAKGTKVYEWNAERGADWEEVADFSAAGLQNISRLAVSPGGDRLALVAADPTP